LWNDYLSPILTVGMRETRIHLEMIAPDELRPASEPCGSFVIARQERPNPPLSQGLYNMVGEAWQWIDRRTWTLDQWLDYLSRPEIETWVMWSENEPAGYFELEDERDGGVNLAYFGLMPSFLGRGLGGHLLTLAVRRAWAKGANRVWVHTCSRDHPHALANYQARGFRVFKVEEL